MTATPGLSTALNVAKAIIRGPSHILASLNERLKRRHCALDEGAILLPMSRISNLQGDASKIRIGGNCRVGGQLLVFAHGGFISIGSDCFIGEDSRIWSAHSIAIGNRVLISHGVNIHDNDSHPMSASSRHRQILEIFSQGHPKVLPNVAGCDVVVEDDAWIGFNAVVLKGVRIGRGAVVGAASVVTKDVDAFQIVVGNPARVVGNSMQ